VKKGMTTRQAEELMQRYAATMRDEKENDLAKLRAMQKVATTEQKAPKKKMSAGVKFAVIAACSCVLILALALPVVFSGGIFFASAPAKESSLQDEAHFGGSSSMEDADHNKSSSSPSKQGYVLITENFRLVAPDGNAVTYELLPAEERPSGSGDKFESVGLQVNMLYSHVKWIVFSDQKGLNARVYVTRLQEKKDHYEKTYDSSVSFRSFILSYKITSSEAGVFSAQGKIESNDETLFIEYSQTGGNLESFCNWVNAAVSAK